MYVEVKWRKLGIPTKDVIIDAASAGFSSRKDQDCTEIYDDISYDEAVAFLKRLIFWDHTSVLEHIVFKFRATVSVACAAQIKTHRMASYTQKSFRIVRVFDEESFIVPPQIKPEDMSMWTDYMKVHFMSYEHFLNKGYSSDVARFLLPHGVMTNIAITMNARSLRNMFKYRLDSHAMFEFQDVCKEMVKLIREEGLYFLFEDVIKELEK